jgi:RNA polymerase sigma-70 factor (ECF subfamily)
VDHITDFFDLDDRALIAAHTNGNPDAFGELVRRHQDRLWAIAMRTLGDPQEASDAVQEALISAFRSASKYRGDAAVTTWLHRIVVNACIDRMRRNKSRPTRSNALDLTDHPAFTDQHDRIDDQLISLDVRAALEQLPPEQRAAVVAVDVLGYSIEDAAELLGIPAGTVKSRCFRGRGRLLPLLEPLRNRDGTESVTPMPEPPQPTASGGE